MSPWPLLLLFVLVDVLGFSLVLPLFPYFTKELGMSPTMVGLLQASNALAQLFAVPVIGALSDKFGRRPLLLVCVAGTFTSFVLLARADTIWMLFLSRILDGLLGGNISLAQSYIADITSPEQRERGMGLIGAMFGLGFTVGPAIGGTLSRYGMSVPSYLAAVLCVINFFGVLFFLPESLPPEKREKSGQRSVLPSFGGLYKCLQDKTLGFFLIMRFLSGFNFTAFETSFGFYNKGRLNLNRMESSLLLTFFGLVYSISMGGFRRITKRFENSNLLADSFALLAVSYIFSGITFALWQHVIVLIPLGVLSGVVFTIITAKVSNEVEAHEVGGTLGVSAALGSLTRILAPTASGVLLDTAGLSSPSVLCAIISVALYFMSRSMKIKKQVKAE